MSIAELKEKIVEEVTHLDDEKTLEQVLSILSHKAGNNSGLIDAMKYKEQLFKKHNGLLERLS